MHQQRQMPLKRQLKQLRPRKVEMKKRKQEEDKRPSLSTFTKFWDKFTQKLVSQEKQWTSWTHSLMISLIELLLNPASWLDSTREEHSAQGKSKQQSNCFSQENWPDMPSLKEQKLSPNIPVVDLLQLIEINNKKSLPLSFIFIIKFAVRLSLILYIMMEDI